MVPVFLTNVFVIPITRDLIAQYQNIAAQKIAILQPLNTKINFIQICRSRGRHFPLEPLIQHLM